MKPELKDLLDLLDLEQIEVNMFRGVSPDDGWQRVFGGQVIGQALVAASRTVEDVSRTAHSLHGYFLRPGDTTSQLSTTLIEFVMAEVLQPAASLRCSEAKRSLVCQFHSK